MSAVTPDPFAPEALTFGSVVGRICSEAVGRQWSLDTLADYAALIRSGIPEKDFREATTGAVIWDHFIRRVKEHRSEIEARLKAEEAETPLAWKQRAVEIGSHFIFGEYSEEDLKDFAVLSQLYPEAAAAIREVLKNEPK